jgi:hypothetical protein
MLEKLVLSASLGLLGQPGIRRVEVQSPDINIVTAASGSDDVMPRAGLCRVSPGRPSIHQLPRMIDAA